MLCGAHLGLQEIWSGASPKGVTSHSCFQEHHSRHTKDTNIFCMKALHRMAVQPKQGDLMHVDTQTCPSLMALCTDFIPGCKLVSQKQNDASLRRVPHIAQASGTAQKPFAMRLLSPALPCCPGLSPGSWWDRKVSTEKPLK